MPSPGNKLIRNIGVGIAIAGVAIAFFAGSSTLTNFMMAGGCLIWLAAFLAHWWGRK